MEKLKLYTAFHLNLAFSSIPEEQYSLVIDRCYWPMIDILEKFENIRFGIEFTGYTLEKIEEVDYTFVEKLKELNKKGKCEFLGSGMSQAIFPLIPQKINVKNLQEGNRVYGKILGELPVTAYVNEQCYSDGIAPIYAECGYKNIILEYENANLFNNYPKGFKYKSHHVDACDKKLDVVWNHSIAFQKMQKYAFGEIELQEYMNYLESHIGDESRAICMYGSDLEIFDYKPGNYDWFYNPKESMEMDRIHDLFEFINESEKFEFILPREVAQDLNSGEKICVSTPQYPITTKKQPKYNVLRWAVSGLKNTKMNTECNRIYNKLMILESMGEEVDEEWKNLCLLYGSDYRTKTTESKFEEYYSLLGKTESMIEEKIERREEGEPGHYDFCLWNTNDYDLKENTVYEFGMKFDKGFIYEGLTSIEIDDKETVFQFEDVEYYRDGSIRKAKIVLELPRISGNGKVHGVFKKCGKIEKLNNWSLEGNSFETERVAVEFSNTKKGTIKRLEFKEISDKSILGNVKHGIYDDIRYSADYFSGHTILRESTLRQITDLDNSMMIYPDTEEKRYNVRIPVKSKIEGEFGELWKIYYVYINQNRIDIEYNFRFKDIKPVFFRTGILTFDPGFFDVESLKYSANNGGALEEFKLAGMQFNQSEMVSMNISANGCIGATEGMLLFKDNKKEISIQRDNSMLYTVPMIQYREINGKYLLRLYHSLSETDDTGSIFWRGHSKFRMSISDSRDKMFEEGIILIKGRKYDN